MGGCYEFRELRNEEARLSVRFRASFLNAGVAQREERSTEPLYSPKDARYEAGSRPAPDTSREGKQFERREDM